MKFLLGLVSSEEFDGALLPVEQTPLPQTLYLIVWVRFPALLLPYSVNHSARSGPAVMPGQYLAETVGSGRLHVAG